MAAASAQAPGAAICAGLWFLSGAQGALVNPFGCGTVPLVVFVGLTSWFSLADWLFLAEGLLLAPGGGLHSPASNTDFLL